MHFGITNTLMWGIKLLLNLKSNFNKKKKSRAVYYNIIIMIQFIYLLYNSSELKTQLDHVVSGHGVICHCSKWRPEKEGAPGMNH